MKVALFGVNGDFDNSRGEALQRYMYELYTNLLQQNVDVAKEMPDSNLPFSTNGLSLLLYESFKNLGSYDIVHSLDVKPVMPLRRRRGGFVVTVSDLIPTMHPEYTKDYRSTRRGFLWIELVAKPGLDLALRFSDSIITISSMVRDEVVATGYDKDRVFMVNDGIDTRFLAKVRQKRQIDKFVVGYLGNFVHRKNVSFALRAFMKWGDNRSVFNLFGKQALNMDALVEMARADKRVRFNGAVNESRLVSTYDSFDAFVFPSLYEGFGLPILEAQARGLPVVICKHARIPKEVKRFCLEAEDEDHMAQILGGLKENGYNDKLRKKATEYARGFTWEKTARETVKVYEKVMGT